MANPVIAMRTRTSAARQRGFWWVPLAVAAAQAASSKDQTRRANNTATDLSNSSLQRRAADARAAGLHPLAALGSGGASTPPIQVGDYGSAIQSLGEASQSFDNSQDTRRAAGANADSETRRKMLLEQHDWARESHEMQMQLDRQRLIRLQTEPGTGPAVSSPVSSGNVAPFQLITPNPDPRSSPVGLSAKSKPAMERYYAGNSAYDLPNSDLAEVLEGMGAAGHVIGPLMMYEHRKARELAERDTYLAQKGRDALGPPKKGHYWHFDQNSQSWFELRKGTRELPRPAYSRGLGFDDQGYVYNPRRKGQ